MTLAKSTTGIPAMPFSMNSIQMGRAASAPDFSFTERNLFIVVADPNACSDLRRESDEPGVGEVLRGAGFSAGGTANRFCLDGSAELDDLFEHGRHRVRHIRRNDVMDFRVRFFEERAIVAGDAANHVRIDADAIVRENSEGGDMFKQLHVGGAKR